MLNSSSFIACLVSILFLTSLNACVSSQVETEIEPIDTHTFPAHSATFTPKTTPSGNPDIVAGTPMPTSLTTLTPIPTLPAEKAYHLLADWLQNDNDCQLPCWGGLTVGKSFSTEAYSKVMAFSSIASYTDLFHPTGGWVSMIHPSDDLDIRIDVDVRSKVNEKNIQVLKITARVLRKIKPGSYEEVYNAPAYNALLQDYALGSILSKYGPPADIWVRADIYTYSGTQETFNITLLYPERGIFVRYSMLAERIGNQIRGCPSHSFVELWLLSPDDKDSYQEILLSQNVQWEGNWPYTTPIQNVASMTIDEFYQTFKEATDKCLVTPLNAWPDH